MCEMCLDHGEGTEWYFNAANYARRLYKVRKEAAEGTGAEVSQAGFPMADEMLELVEAKDRGDMETYEALVREHEGKARRDALGQVVTLDEVLRAVDLMYPIARQSCACRRMTQVVPPEEDFTCIGIGPGMYKWERWPENFRGGIEYLHPDDCRDLLMKWNKRGFVQIMITQGTPYLGAICNCQYPDCLLIRQRLDYGIRSFWKGHYVTRVNPNLCIGCGLCVSKCQFKAVSFNPSRDIAYIDMLRCFGCGQCVSVCEPGAITLEQRQAVPTLANSW